VIAARDVGCSQTEATALIASSVNMLIVGKTPGATWMFLFSLVVVSDVLMKSVTISVTACLFLHECQLVVYVAQADRLRLTNWASAFFACSLPGASI
jgi:hypothetical protein